MESDTPGSANQLYTSFGWIPTLSASNYAEDGGNQANRQIAFSIEKEGYYYLLVHNSYVPAGQSNTCRLTATILPSFNVNSMSIDYGSTKGEVTTVVSGAGLKPDISVELVAPNGFRLGAKKTWWKDSSEIWIRLDLTQIPFYVSTDYTCDVEFTSGLATVVLHDSFTVTNSQVVPLELSFSAPSHVRDSRSFPVTVYYRNTGQTDLEASLLLLQASIPVEVSRPQSIGMWPVNASGTGTTVTVPTQMILVPVASSPLFFACNNTGPAGILPPGASGSISFTLLVPGIQAHQSIYYSVSTLDLDHNLYWDLYADYPDPLQRYWRVVFRDQYTTKADGKTYYVQADGSQSNYEYGKPLPGEQLESDGHTWIYLPHDPVADTYVSIKQQSQPPYIQDDAWDAMWNVLRNSVGETWGDLQRAIADNATHLSLLGQDVNPWSYEELLSFEYSQANNSLFGGPLDSALDIYDPAPGLPLTFSRVFPATITGRHTLGDMGYGWSHEWDIRIVPTEEAVYIDGPLGVRAFTWDEHEQLIPTPGDTGQMSFTGSNWVLQERNGLTNTFDRPSNRLESVTDSNGNEITFTYDASDRLTQLTHSNGDTLTISYNGAGLIDQVVDSTGSSAGYSYDANDHLVSVTRSDGTCLYQYSLGVSGPNQHALIRTETPDGSIQTFSYDSNGRVLRVGGTDNPDLDTLFYYGTTGVVYMNRILSSLPPNTTPMFTTNEYTLYPDDRGQVTRMIDPLGRILQAQYDQNGRLINQILPNGARLDYVYDQDGHLIGSQDALGQWLSFDYNPADHYLTSVTDQRGNRTGYQYDDYGNLTAIVHVDGSAEQFTYDTLGNLTSSTDRRGQVINYTYSNDGLLTQKDYEDGSADVFTYDARGNMLTATDPSGITTLEYNDPVDPDLITKITYPNGRFLQYTYDNFGRRTRMEDQGGFVTTYTYDSAGRLHILADGAGNPLVTYTYDPDGRLSREDKGNGTYTTYSYDLADQLLSLVNYASDGSVNSRFDYTYDAIGQRIAMSTLEGNWTYQYDATGQLVRAIFASNDPTTVPDQDLTYVYDPAGNRIQTIVNGVTTDYSSANNLNQYGTVGTATYQYDAAGNLIGKTDGVDTWTYTYDDQNRLVGVVTPNGTWHYDYDIFGQRIATIKDGVRTEYLVDPFGFGDVVAEYDAAGSALTTYSHGLGLEGSHAPAGAVSYYDFDAIGSTAGFSGSEGNYLNQYSYLPFGEELISVEITNNSFQFVGQWGVMDESNGLDFMRARFYDEGDGRFINPDPIGQVGGFNLYSYAASNPISIVDPVGMTQEYVVDQDEATINRIRDYNNWKSTVNKSWKEGIGDYGKTTARSIPNAVEVYRDPFNLKKWYDYGKKLWRDYMDLGDRLDRNPTWHKSGPGTREAPRGDTSAGWRTHFLFSGDPNDIIGPQGFGPENWIAGPSQLAYTIRCENDPEKATAAARVIRITQQLDDDLDYSTFRLGDFGFNNFFVDIPDDLSYYEARLDVVDTLGIYVDVRAGIDLATGEIFWELISIDPATGDFVTDPFAGLLPPNYNPPQGDAYFTYTVSTKSTVASGDVIDAQATIIFDTNAPIATPPIFNTLDIAGPTSQVNPLLVAIDDPTFMVSWIGEDDTDGSGIAYYDIYVSDNAGPFELWIERTSETSAVFEGEAGHTYAFYSTATDNVGYMESAPNVPDTQTQVVLPNAPPVANDDTAATPEDTVLNIVAPGVLGDDNDLDGDPLAAVLDTDVTNGTLILNADGSFSYTPNPDFNGTDSFIYHANDGALDSNIATVTITVNPVNDSPSFTKGSDIVANEDSGPYTESNWATNISPGPPNESSQTVNFSVSNDNNSLFSVQPVISSNGTLTFTPTTDAFGSATITVIAQDDGGTANGGQDTSAPQTFTITVNPVNDPPDISGLPDRSLNEDSGLDNTIDLWAYTSDVETADSSLTFSIVDNTNPNCGVLIDSNRYIDINPAPDWYGTSDVTIEISDGELTDTDMFSIKVASVNDAPVANDDSAITAEDTAVLIDVATNDTDVDANLDATTAMVVSGPSNGSVSNNGDGIFTYTPDVDYYGADSFVYEIYDTESASDTAAVNITVSPVNDAPIANDDTYTTDEDTPLTVATPGVLANDIDVDGDPLTAVLDTDISHGTLVLNADGSFIYTPNVDYNGADSFTYQANDGALDSNIATVKIVINSVNDAPVANDDAASTAEDTAVIIDVLANATDTDGDTLTAVLDTGVSNGTLILNADGSFTYTPDPNFNGTDSFIYHANDGLLDSNVATVTITINAVNDVPLAADDAYAIDEDTTLNVVAPGVLGNDTDVDGDSLTAVLDTDVANGTLTLNADGSFTYTPDQDFVGIDTFTYHAHDGTADSNVTTVTINIIPENDAPVAFDDSYATPEDTVLSVLALDGVLGNDSDIDGDALTAVLDVGPSHGTLTLNGDGSFEYIPVADYNGSDSFTYYANDRTADSNIVTVTIDVTPENDAPVASDDAYNTDEDTALVVAAPGVLSNDSDVDGDPLTVVLDDGSSNGTLTLNPNGSFSYTPDLDFNGTDSFTYHANDGMTDSNIAAVTITVNAVNDAPVANDDSATTSEDVVVLIDVAANDTDVDGNLDATTAAVVSGPSNGTVTNNGDGTFTYTPDTDYNGPDSFVYEIFDTEGAGDAAVVDITVTSVNDVPVANDDTYNTDEDTALIVAAPGVLANDSDVDGEPLTAVLNVGPSNGTLTLNPDGSFTYTPDLDFNGTDSFTYHANDGTTDSNIATVTITVNPSGGGVDPSEILGIVWEDFNNNGEIDFNEKTIENITINLGGIDDRGVVVNLTTQTNIDGVYIFYDLRPGEYIISEIQPTGFEDGNDTVGTVNGVATGDNSVNDVFSGVILPEPGSFAENYNFGERPSAGNEVTAGYTAMIGFWQNKNGQSLIKSLNGGPDSTQLGDWLAATFPNIYGVNAGINGLTGMTNAEVADFYGNLFRRKRKDAMQLGLGGPTKMDVQVMAVAFAVYVTNSSLAGTTASTFGFLVTEYGVGFSTFNVGSNGDAFNVEDDSDVTIMDLLLAANSLSTGGVLYDLDGDGDADDTIETIYRTMANDVFSDINEQGDLRSDPYQHTCTSQIAYTNCRRSSQETSVFIKSTLDWTNLGLRFATEFATVAHVWRSVGARLHLGQLHKSLIDKHKPFIHKPLQTGHTDQIY